MTKDDPPGNARFRATVITLYPDAFPGALGIGVIGRALGQGQLLLETVNPRDHAEGKHRTVDDTPAGGGPGMVLRADVLARTLDTLPPEDTRPRLLLSPRGAPFTQSRAHELVASGGAVLICGRFEGVDERVIEARDLEEVSVGDYVLAGGELGAQIVIEACARLVPGVLGAPSSRTEESFEHGLLEYPHYTRPREFEGRSIPDILLSGDHARIAEWRRARAEEMTRARRPDLLPGGVQSGENQEKDERSS